MKPDARFLPPAHTALALSLLLLPTACATAGAGPAPELEDGAELSSIAQSALSPRASAAAGATAADEQAGSDATPSPTPSETSDVVDDLAFSRRAAPTEEADPDAWRFNASIYLWMAGASGSVFTPSGLGVPISASFSDILSSLDSAFMFDTQGRGKHWGYQLDLVSMGLDNSTPGATGDIDVGLDMLVTELDAMYSPTLAPELQFLAGLRVTGIEQSVQVPLGAQSSAETTVWDPVVGAKGSWRLGERWRFNLRGDVGGFGVGSELTYQGVGAFIWQFGRHWDLDLGYRLLAYDINSGGVDLDAQFHGAFLGLTFEF